MKSFGLVFAGFFLFLFACGSDDTPAGASQTESGTSPTSPTGTCEAAGTRLCERACACATDGKCHLGVTTDAGTAAINFDDEKACRDLYVVVGCAGGGEPGFDYGRCESAVQAAACVDTAGGRGGLFPAECNVNRK